MRKEKKALTIDEFTLRMTREEVEQLYFLKESSYMLANVEKVTEFIINIWQNMMIPKDVLPAEDLRDVLSSDDAMEVLSILHQVRMDYRTLTSFDIDEKEPWEMEQEE